MITSDEMKTEIRRLARGLLHHNIGDTVWVDSCETMLDALDKLYEKLDGGDLQYAIDLEDELKKEREAFDAGLPLKPKSAVDRAMEMMRVKQSELPPLAFAYASRMCQQLGMCMEVYITAFAHYAQAVEKLPCDDDLYQIPADAQKWFDDNKA